MAVDLSDLTVTTSANEGDVEAVMSIRTGTEVGAAVLDALYRDLGEFQARVGVHRELTRCQEASGGHVVMYAGFHHMPALIDAQGQPVLLYEFVEGLDGILAYDDVKAEFSLTHGQIDSALSFLRRVAMINPERYDPDAIEDAADAIDEGLLEALGCGAEYTGGLRVLDAE